MNKLTCILAAAFGAAIAVALVATFSPTPSAAWVLWALLGGAVGYLAQSPRVAAIEAFTVSRSVAKVVARRLRHGRRRAFAFGPVWAKIALATFRPSAALASSLILFGLAIAVVWINDLYLPVNAVLVAAVFAFMAGVIWLLEFSPYRSLSEFCAAPRRVKKVVEWKMRYPSIPLGLPRPRREEDYWVARHRCYLNARRTFSRLSFGEVAFSVACCWLGFLASAVMWTTLLIGVVCAALIVVAYPVTTVSVLVLAVAALLWRLLLRGVGKIILAAARRLHTQDRLAAGSGASLGAIAGLALSLAWGVLGVPVLAALVGALSGALCGWILVRGSAAIVARFSVAATV